MQGDIKDKLRQQIQSYLRFEIDQFFMRRVKSKVYTSVEDVMFLKNFICGNLTEFATHYERNFGFKGKPAIENLSFYPSSAFRHLAQLGIQIAYEIHSNSDWEHVADIDDFCERILDIEKNKRVSDDKKCEELMSYFIRLNNRWKSVQKPVPFEAFVRELS